MGVYRGLWRYTSIGDLIVYVKGVAAGSVVSIVAVLILYRFQYFSRAVFILNAIILLFALAGSRMAFRLIRQVLPIPMMAEGRNVLIYGAGDGGELVYRELKNNRDWQYVPVGFIDDDPMKKDKIIHGLRVYDPNGSLPDVCRSKEVSEILISFRDVPPEKMEGIRRMCRQNNVGLQRALLKIEPVDFE